MNSNPVNWQQLATDVETARQERGLSLREVGRQTGLAVSGLVKLRQGGKMSADAVASLNAWLNTSTPDLDSETLADTIALCTGPDTAAAVDAALRYVTGRVKCWTQETLDHGVLTVHAEHQATRVQRAADELRHYLAETVRRRANGAAPPPAVPTPEAPQPQSGQAAQQPAPPAGSPSGQDEPQSIAPEPPLGQPPGTPAQAAPSPTSAPCRDAPAHSRPCDSRQILPPSDGR